MRTASRRHLHCLLKAEPCPSRQWVATCLENALAAQGDSAAEALESLLRTMAGQYTISGKEAFDALPEAPDEDFRAYRFAYQFEFAHEWGLPGVGGYDVTARLCALSEKVTK